MLLAVSRSWLLHLSSGLLSGATWHSMHSYSLCPVSSGYGQASFRQVRGFRLRYLKAAITDYKMYLGMLIYMGCDMPLYAFSPLPALDPRGTGLHLSQSPAVHRPVYSVGQRSSRLW